MDNSKDAGGSRTHFLLLCRQPPGRLAPAPKVSFIAASAPLAFCTGATRIAGSKVQHPAVRRTGHVICVRRVALGDHGNVCKKWVERRSNPPLRFFRPSLNHLSYRPVYAAGPSGEKTSERKLEQSGEAARKKPGVKGAWGRSGNSP